MSKDQMLEQGAWKVRGKCVFVAGGAGFLGSAVVRELLEVGAKVTSYDSYFHGSRDKLANLSGALTIVDGDGRDEADILNAIRTARPDFIINCIGDTYVPTRRVGSSHARRVADAVRSIRSECAALGMGLM